MKYSALYARLKPQMCIRDRPLEQHVLNELIKGPSNTNLNPVLSSDTSVISVQTTDGTCFINFNSNFISRNSGTPDKEDTALYAIVNSLTELDSVNSVQILIDGKKISSFGTTSMGGTISVSYTHLN